MKKRIVTLVALFAVVLSAFSLTSCGKKLSYGSVEKSAAELKAVMEENSLSFAYPQYLGEKEGKTETDCIAVKDSKSGEYTGYKIYQFGKPFYTSVTAYKGESGKLLSDEETRTEFIGKLPSKAGEISLYAGKGHKDALYLIGCVNIGGNHYEIRVTNDETMTDGVYDHAVYADNEYYTQALDVITKISESIH